MKVKRCSLVLVGLAVLLVVLLVGCCQYAEEDFDACYETGHADGYATGYSEGYDSGYDVGYDKGYETGEEFLYIFEQEAMGYSYAQGFEIGYYEGLECCDVEQAKVTRVIDGDTIEVETAYITCTVRYIGIDAPEIGQPFASEATEKNRELVEGEVVWLEKGVSLYDEYGQKLRYVYVGSVMVNAELVRLGYAVVSSNPPDVKYEAYFYYLQYIAQEENRGIW